LRQKSTTRLVFRPQVVNNTQDKNKPVNGELLWQKRKPSEKGEEWVDESHKPLTHMEAGSGVKLHLSTDELHLLTQAVRGLYGVYWKHGHQLPKTGDELDLVEYARVAKTHDVLENAASIISATGQERFVSLLKWLAGHDHSAEVVEALPKLNPADLAGINSLAGIGMLKQALAIWQAHNGNADEEFWQDTLRQYSFVFSQVFSTPVVVFGTKAYVGGKSLEAPGERSPISFSRMS
jgi:hypothetical protein